jgi:hypothetical protein
MNFIVKNLEKDSARVLNFEKGIVEVEVDSIVEVGEENPQRHSAYVFDVRLAFQ